MKTYIEQEKIVFEKWESLISELNQLLEIARKKGGTLGHKVGSMRDKQIEMKSRF